MTEIPDDIPSDVVALARKYSMNDDVLLAVCRAILAERERCAKAMGEPVAWVYEKDLREGDGSFGRVKGDVFMSRDGYWVNLDTPLYAAPKTTVDM